MYIYIHIVAISMQIVCTGNLITSLQAVDRGIQGNERRYLN